MFEHENKKINLLRSSSRVESREALRSVFLNPRPSSLCPNAPAVALKIIVPMYPCQTQRVKHHCKRNDSVLRRIGIPINEFDPASVTNQ